MSESERKPAEDFAAMRREAVGSRRRTFEVGSDTDDLIKRCIPERSLPKLLSTALDRAVLYRFIILFLQV